MGAARAGLVLLLAAACGVLAACERSGRTTDDDPRPDQIYVVRGIIAQLPGDGPAASLQITHEAIDHYVRPDGSLGMPAMTMPFPVAEGVSLAGRSVGEKVEFEFAVWQGPPLRYRLTRIAPLPAGTELDLGG